MRNVGFTKAAAVEEKNRPVLDRVDYRILDLVQREGALPVAEIAARTGLSTTTCWRRLQSLEQSGVIRGRVAVLDRAARGRVGPHLSRFASDPVQAVSRAVAVLRLADAPLLPFDFSALADATQEYLADLKRLLQRRQEEISERNRLIDDGVFQAILDPRRPTVAPPREEVPPHLNFAPLENAVEALQRSAARYEKARAGIEGRSVPPDVLSRTNALLIRSERVLLSADGLPRRPWFKHLLYAPGVYAGYGAKTMPGAREAIELKRYSEADGEIARIAKVLKDEAALADEAAAELERP
jgi:DNA-binding Lrp family transcriptional regulator